MDRDELVVVGGGVAGASAAIEAAQRGLNVTLVDEHPVDLATMATGSACVRPVRRSANW